MRTSSRVVDERICRLSATRGWTKSSSQASALPVCAYCITASGRNSVRATPCCVRVPYIRQQFRCVLVSGPQRTCVNLVAPCASTYRSFPRLVTLTQLRFTSFAVVNLREDFQHARAGRTQKKGAFLLPFDQCGLAHQELACFTNACHGRRRGRHHDHRRDQNWNVPMLR